MWKTVTWLALAILLLADASPPDDKESPMGQLNRFRTELCEKSCPICPLELSQRAIEAAALAENAVADYYPFLLLHSTHVEKLPELKNAVNNLRDYFVNCRHQWSNDSVKRHVLGYYRFEHALHTLDRMDRVMYTYACNAESEVKNLAELPNEEIVLLKEIFVAQLAVARSTSMLALFLGNYQEHKPLIIPPDDLIIDRAIPSLELTALDAYKGLMEALKPLEDRNSFHRITASQIFHLILDWTLISTRITGGIQPDTDGGSIVVSERQKRSFDGVGGVLALTVSKHQLEVLPRLLLLTFNKSISRWKGDCHTPFPTRTKANYDALLAADLNYKLLDDFHRHLATYVSVETLRSFSYTLQASRGSCQLFIHGVLDMLEIAYLIIEGYEANLYCDVTPTLVRCSLAERLVVLLTIVRLIQQCPCMIGLYSDRFLGWTPREPLDAAKKQHTIEDILSVHQLIYISNRTKSSTKGL